MTMDRRTSHEAPQILRAEDILAKMRAGTKEVHDIRMRDQVFPVRVLSMDEIALIYREAAGHVAKTGGTELDRNIFIQKSTLKMASTLSVGSAPTIMDALLKLMSLDEVKFMYDEYIRVMDAVNPSIELIPPDQFRALVDALKKSELSSRDCSLLQLRAICSAFQELIQRLENPESPPDS